MQIPLQTQFKDHLGGIITLNAKPDGPPLTVRHCLISAIVNEFEDEQNPATVIQDKLKRFAMYQKLQDTDEKTEYLELSAEDATYLKGRIARVFGMLVSGPVMKMLDGQ